MLIFISHAPTPLAFLGRGALVSGETQPFIPTQPCYSPARMCPCTKGSQEMPSQTTQILREDRKSRDEKRTSQTSKWTLNEKNELEKVIESIWNPIRCGFSLWLSSEIVKISLPYFCKILYQNKVPFQSEEKTAAALKLYYCDISDVVSPLPILWKCGGVHNCINPVCSRPDRSVWCNKLQRVYLVCSHKWAINTLVGKILHTLFSLLLAWSPSPALQKDY